MKTPTEIAAEIADLPHIGAYTNSRSINGDGFRRAIGVAAIEADRAQRDLYELIAEALDDRAENLHDDEYPEHTERRKRAAQRLRDQSADDAWCDFIGPMLDDMEDRYGA